MTKIQIGSDRLLKPLCTETYKSQVGPDRPWKILEQAVMKRAEAQKKPGERLEEFSKEENAPKNEKKEKKGRKKK